MKHNLLIAILLIIGAILISAVVYTAMKTRDIAAPEMTKAGVSVRKNKSAKDEMKTEGSTVSSGYKNVRVSDGIVNFSFEVPEKWLTETRHSGEKQLTIDEMREFLATNFDGDIKGGEVCQDWEEEDADTGKITIRKHCGLLSSDYTDLAWNDIKAMSDKEVKDNFFRKEDDKDVFPNASVTANDFIWYTDISWAQIDFQIVDESAEWVVAKVRKDDKKWCDENGADMAGCGDNMSKWAKAIIDGQNVDFETYATDKDENGNESITKGGSGGKMYYISIPNSTKSLKIWKQAKGEPQFEKDFEHLIQTFKFTK